MTTRRHDRPSVPPIAGIVIGIAAVSSASILIRFAQREAPSLVIAAARLMLASLILAPIAWTRYRDEYNRLTRRRRVAGHPFRHFFGAALCHVDFVARIHDRRQLDGAGEHFAVVRGHCLVAAPAGKDRARRCRRD